MALRDSKTGDVIVYPGKAWRDFTCGVKQGEFYLSLSA
jgi:hypothetical protein